MCTTNIEAIIVVVFGHVDLSCFFYVAMTLKMVIDGDTPEMDGQQSARSKTIFWGSLFWGSPILAETYAVVQMKMIRNPPLIHQGFIEYDAISQNIRKPGFCTLEGPQRDGLERISSHWKPPGILR